MNWETELKKLSRMQPRNRNGKYEMQVKKYGG